MLNRDNVLKWKVVRICCTSLRVESLDNSNQRLIYGLCVKHWAYAINNEQEIGNILKKWGQWNPTDVDSEDWVLFEDFKERDGNCSCRGCWSQVKLVHANTQESLFRHQALSLTGFQYRRSWSILYNRCLTSSHSISKKEGFDAPMHTLCSGNTCKDWKSLWIYLPFCLKEKYISFKQRNFSILASSYYPGYY